MKSKFNVLFESIMKTIAEGGHAVSDVTRIKKENIKSTLDKVEELILKPLGVKREFWTAEIGSAGKKDTSGDLDIAIDYGKAEKSLGIEPNTLMMKAKEKLEQEGYSPAKNANTISFRFPIQGDQVGEFVQIDFFPTNNLEFTKFRMFSPSQEQSKYKGVHRFTLLAAIVKAVTLDVADDAEDRTPYTVPTSDGKPGRVYPAYRFKHLSVLDDGVWSVTKSFKGKSGRFVINPQKIKEMSKLVYTDPQKLLDDLFGEGKYTVADLESFESIWNNILFDPSFPYKDKIDEICIAAWHTIHDQKDTVMPDELQKYVDDHNLIEKTEEQQ